VPLGPERLRDDMLIISHARRLMVRIDVESCSVAEDLLTQVPLSIFADNCDQKKQTTQRGLAIQKLSMWHTIQMKTFIS
jgi:hypothetical protein